MLVGQLQLALRAHHAEAFHIADLADRQRYIQAGHVVTRFSKNTDEACTGIGRTADNLNRLAVPGVDLQDAQTVCVRMLFGFKDFRDLERLEAVGTVRDLFHLKTDHVQAVQDVLKAGIRVQIVLEPGQSEFHNKSLYQSGGVGREFCSRSAYWLKRSTSGITVASP